MFVDFSLSFAPDGTITRGATPAVGDLTFAGTATSTTKAMTDPIDEGGVFAEGTLTFTKD